MLEIKGRVSTLTLIKPKGRDLYGAASQLVEKLQQAPGFFSHTPAVLDLSASESLDGIDALVAAAREGGMIPFAYTGIDAQDQSLAGLYWLPEVKMGGGNKTAEKPVTASSSSAMVVTQPVRSGQQIYAKGRDLVVLNSVSAGAELLADGHIHVYGALRGRAMAGVQGDETAMVFCQKLDAELLSVAGTYIVNEDIEDQHRQQAATVGLQEDRLVVQSL